MEFEECGASLLDSSLASNGVAESLVDACEGYALHPGVLSIGLGFAEFG